MTHAPTEMMDALNATHITVGGRPLDEDLLMRLATEGWTPAAMHECARLAQHSVTAETAFQATRRGNRNVTVEQALTARLITRTLSLADRLYFDEVLDVPTRAYSLEAALSWTTLLVSITEPRDLTRFESHYLWDIPIYQGLCGAFATIVYAAGMTTEEARAWIASPDRDPDAIRTLAGLRDYRWPA